MANKSPVDIVFNEYTRHITSAFLEKYGKSYARQQEIRNSWRDTADYSIEAERLLIAKTKLFITLLPSDDPKSTDPHFLNALTNLMADYLSKYTMRAYNLPNTNKGKKEYRKKAKQLLKHALYDDNGYIQNLYERQRQKREKRNRSSAFRHAENRAAQRTKAQKDYKIQQQVTSIFIEVSMYKKR